MHSNLILENLTLKKQLIEAQSQILKMQYDVIMQEIENINKEKELQDQIPENTDGE